MLRGDTVRFLKYSHIVNNVVLSTQGGYSLIWAIYTVGMCGPKGYDFSAILVINRVSILAIFLPFWS